MNEHKEKGKQWMMNLLGGWTPENLSCHLQNHHSENFLGHYQDQSFNRAALISYAQKMLDSIHTLYHEIEDLVVINDLIAGILRMSWTHQDTKNYHEMKINFIYRLQQDKACELWIMAEQSLEHPEKKKAEFLRRLSTSQYYYQNRWGILTKTEQECLYYYLHGFSSKESARYLGLTYRTIETYIATIKEKYGCSTKSELRDKIMGIQ